MCVSVGSFNTEENTKGPRVTESRALQAPGFKGKQADGYFSSQTVQYSGQGHTVLDSAATAFIPSIVMTFRESAVLLF